MKKILITFSIISSISLKAWCARDAIVVTEGAIVYNKANFDSAVLGYLRAGQQVRISNRTIGAFYRVSFKGRTAYIADVDVRVDGVTVSAPDVDEPESAYQPEDNRYASPKRHLAQAKHIGISAGYTRYFDYITNLSNRSTVNANTSPGVFLYGLKFNLPSSMLAGRLVWDVTTHISLQRPYGYDRQIAVFFEPQLLFFLDAISTYNGFLFLGLGPTFSYWNVSGVNSTDVDVKTSTTGYGFNVVASFHLGIRIKSIALKIEPRYYLLNAARYFAIVAAVQKIF